ncbi:MAG: undecaprenyl-diphosphate phosphatase [Lachnospiraceae bacterium]
MEIIEILKAILFGILEGITEWLPVSSTGHLILLNEWVQFSICESEEKLAAFMEVFDVVIQLGAILAVVLIFFKDIWPFGWKKEMAAGMSVSEIPSKEKKCWKWGKLLIWKDIIFLWLKIVVACIPAMIYGVLLDDKMEELMAPYKAVIVAVMLVLVGIVFIVVENHYKGKTARVTTAEALDYRLAFWIGVFQLVAAVLPGTSRSGATIIGGLLLGLSRSVAAEFTFYLAIPTMFGASLLKVVKFLAEGMSFTSLEIMILLISSITAFVVSMIVIKFFMSYIKKHDFKVFGWYRIVLGALLLCYFLIR